MTVQTGLNLFAKRWPRSLRGARVGLVVHPASVDSSLTHAINRFRDAHCCRLTTLFGPQHGILGQTQDNMIEWRGYRDRRLNLPVYSLYGEVRKPMPEMLKDIDVLVVDLQDVGARYYTFIWTLDLCMEACSELGKALMVLDRPNPINGIAVEGPVLQPAYASFVGLRPLPVRHGMTIGEIGFYLRELFFPQLRYHVIRMEGWRRGMWFDETGLPWVLPSPNMPTLDTATVYPGMCLLEGTMLSEGRGTTRPFETFGAPYINADMLVQQLRKMRLPGVVFRPLQFETTFQKHAGKLCGGAQIHVTDRERFSPWNIALAILKVVHDTWPKQFVWKRPPYEYESKKRPIDILVGSDYVRRALGAGTSFREICKWSAEQATMFKRDVRRHFLMYED
ncbi:MAG TPA: DUF1343 domain-containing protein [Dissulfurispiraceae bacterium]|nr:DUF1343 domain-containing protein [Dissulfurispiraceae bacterium]